MVLIAILVIKAVILFGIVRIYSKAKVAFKTAVALSQVGEFSFAIFALAGNKNILDGQLVQMLVLTVVLSIVVTPFILSKINAIAGLFFKEASMTEDFGSLAVYSNHVIVCGYGVVGKFVVKALRAEEVKYIIVDNSYKHVQEALADGEKAYYGDMSKMQILEKLHTKEAISVIVTLDNSAKKRLVCESILSYAPNVKVVVKVVSLEEKRELRGLPISVTVDGKREVAAKLVCEALYCELENKEI